MKAWFVFEGWRHPIRVYVRVYKRQTLGLEFVGWSSHQGYDYVRGLGQIIGSGFRIMTTAWVTVWGYSMGSQYGVTVWGYSMGFEYWVTV